MALNKTRPLMHATRDVAVGGRMSPLELLPGMHASTRTEPLVPRVPGVPWPGCWGETKSPTAEKREGVSLLSILRPQSTDSIDAKKERNRASTESRRVPESCVSFRLSGVPEISRRWMRGERGDGAAAAAIGACALCANLLPSSTRRKRARRLGE
ncbi:hypothetical protein MPH_12583 [Macrophomina phaseolina MS6]|uniref:Uncharacterized protein n=1 Tax=Macrophomina phaseolina (strain MS6) TaxID=1126212 RepID=K2R7J7_MACPH|nr:hypothetical protein MPH_12583 [Macrophomina phaseolina MS6]